MSTTKIIDVSKYQGIIDYDKVKKEGKIDAVILRSSIGTSTDDKFYEYVDGFKKAGIPIVGIYHFSHAVNESDVMKEASLAMSNAEKARLDKKTIIFFDFEYESIDVFKTKATPTKNVVSSLAVKFCSAIRSAGYVSGIYFNPDFYNNWFNKDALANNIKWLADWRGSRSLECDIWQYGTATIPGIQNKVDVNEGYIFDFSKDEKIGSISKPASKPLLKKSNEEVAKDVIAGKYGNGEDRKKKLKEAGYDYNAVQSIVNKLVAPKQETKPKKSNEEVANDVIKGLYGNGEERKKKLAAEGYDYNAVQSIVNKLVNTGNNSKSKVAPAQSRDNSLTGGYVVTASALNMRFTPGLLTNTNVIRVLNKGQVVQNYGYYSTIDGVKWLYVAFGSETGYVDSRYVTKK